MKRFISIFFLLTSFISISYTKDRFPILMLDDCVRKHAQLTDINQCEYNNYRVANEALGIFYLNLQYFLPEEHHQTLEASQTYWENFADATCTVSAARYTESEEQNAVAKIHCLNHRIEERIDNLVYLVMLWEEKLGSFQGVLDRAMQPNQP